MPSNMEQAGLVDVAKLKPGAREAYTIWGFSIPGPPLASFQLNGQSAPTQVTPATTYSVGGQNLYLNTAKLPGPTQNLELLSCPMSFAAKWPAWISTGHQTLEWQVTMERMGGVSFQVGYSTWGSGTDEHVSCAWLCNGIKTPFPIPSFTENWPTLTTPLYILPAGEHKVQFTWYVADDNYIGIWKLGTTPTPAMQITATFWWEVVTATVINAGGSYNTTAKYTVGKSHSSSTTSKFSESLGLGLSGVVDAISGSLSANFSKSTSKTNTITVEDTGSTTYEINQGAASEKDAPYGCLYQVWQPCCEFRCGDATWTERLKNVFVPVMKAQPPPS